MLCKDFLLKYIAKKTEVHHQTLTCVAWWAQANNVERLTLNASHLLVQPRLITDIQCIYALIASKRERTSTHTVYVATSPVRCWHIVMRLLIHVHGWFHARTEPWRYEDFPAQHRAERDVKFFWSRPLPNQSARRNGDCSPQRTRKYIKYFL